MDLGISNKKALVTGTGKGIGYGIAVALAREGVKVAAVSSTQEKLDDLMQEIGGEQVGHYAMASDLLLEGAPAEVMEELEASFGKIDILVNNLGGTMNITNPFCPLADWRKIYRMNLEVAVEFTNLVLPYMKARGWGRIINISSTSGMENNGPVTYCAMKAAIIAYAHGLGRVLAKDGVVVSTVLPGAVYTEGGYWDYALRENPEHVKMYLENRCPQGSFGDIDDIGSMVAYLASEQAKFCQGAVVPVDGGQSRHYFVK